MRLRVEPKQENSLQIVQCQIMKENITSIHVQLIWDVKLKEEVTTAGWPMQTLDSRLYDVARGLPFIYRP